MKRPTRVNKSKLPVGIVVALIDETGSMATRYWETINGYNTYLDALKQAEHANIIYSSLKFDKSPGHPTTRMMDNAIPISAAKMLTQETYSPRGATPLYDAIGQAVHIADQMRMNHPGSRVTIMIQTDGWENASTEFSFAAVQNLIKIRQEWGYEFQFLAADLKEAGYQMAQGLGISRGSTMSYTNAGAEHAFVAAAMNTAIYSSGMSNSTSFTATQKASGGDTTDKA